MHCLFLAFATAACLFITASAKPVTRDLHRNSLRLHLPTGTYAGLLQPESASAVYYGVKYATAQRFHRARPLNQDDTKIVRDATTFGDACPNFGLPPPYDEGLKFQLGTQKVGKQSEDCLNMDLYLPAGAPSTSSPPSGLPILVNIHGGGFLVGTSYTNNMSTIVHRSVEEGTPVIAISLNYRLGPLGFLNPSTQGDEGYNLGLDDQRQALLFIKENAHHFGGHPGQITVMGVSAGAESTLHQLLASVDAADKIVSKAWIASTPTNGASFLKANTTYKDSTVESIAKAIDCHGASHGDHNGASELEASVECLRRAPLALFNSSAVALAYAGSGSGLKRSNVFAHVDSLSNASALPPVVLTTTRDEGTSFAAGFNASSDEDFLSNGVDIITSIAGKEPTAGERAAIHQATLSAYPPAPDKGCPFDSLGSYPGVNIASQYKRLAAFTTDATWSEGIVRLVKSFRRVTSTWFVAFEARPLDKGAPVEYGIYHGSDIPYYFPSALSSNDAVSQAVTRRLHDALIAFVVSGKPDIPPVSRLGDRGGFIESSLPNRPGFDVLARYFR